ncbi:MAG: hypothetical protein D6692_11205 [Planctomycetota bacterium]|nr:MAG: hypothetical protein D6692_11205 [Planctomycetota bacterium]
MGTNGSSKLFETPAGIRIIDRIDLSCESTVAFEWPEDGLAAGEDLFIGFDPEARIARVRDGTMVPVDAAPVIRRRPGGRPALMTRGARFVYAMVGLCLSVGVLALAAVTAQEALLWISTIGTIVCGVWFMASLLMWLDRSPYFYRLMTSLGENADNISQLTVLRWLRQSVRSLYS